MSSEIFCHRGHRELREKGRFGQLRQWDREAKLPKLTGRWGGVSIGVMVLVFG